MSEIRVTVVYASPDVATEIAVCLPAGATVADAIKRSGMGTRRPEANVGGAAVGIFGKRVRRDAVLSDGDRIELYRPLTADPKQARRRRAADKRR